MNRINWTELKPQIQQVGRLSLPAILTQITTIAMQYIDSAMVGALGANASAAIGLVSSTTWLLSGTIYAVSAGFSVQVAHQIGGNHDKKARDVVRHGIASALVVSAVLCLIGLLISHPLPGWLGGAQKIRQNATLYFMMFAIMLPFSQLNSLMSSFLQCSGDTQYFKCRYVRARCHFQCSFDSGFRCHGCRYGNDAGLRRHQPHGCLVLLCPQSAAASPPEGKNGF